jgi:hypothetical protein
MFNNIPCIFSFLPSPRVNPSQNQAAGSVIGKGGNNITRLRKDVSSTLNAR